jgi:hypothetical protein
VGLGPATVVRLEGALAHDGARSRGCSGSAGAAHEGGSSSTERTRRGHRRPPRYGPASRGSNTRARTRRSGFLRVLGGPCGGWLLLLASPRGPPRPGRVLLYRSVPRPLAHPRDGRSEVRAGRPPFRAARGPLVASQVVVSDVDIVVPGRQGRSGDRTAEPPQRPSGRRPLRAVGLRDRLHPRRPRPPGRPPRRPRSRRRRPAPGADVGLDPRYGSRLADGALSPQHRAWVRLTRRSGS